MKGKGPPWGGQRHKCLKYEDGDVLRKFRADQGKYADCALWGSHCRSVFRAGLTKLQSLSAGTIPAE